jgi:hypothetical protein
MKRIRAKSGRRSVDFVALFAAPAACVVVAGMAATSAQGSVNLAFDPGTEVVQPGAVIEVHLTAAATGPGAESVGAVDAIVTWDPTALQFLGFTSANADYAWFVQGLLPDPDGINIDTSDGEVIYTALAQPTGPAAIATVDPGIVVTTFRFTALTRIDLTNVVLEASSGSFAETRVLSFSPPNQNITGDIATQTSVHILCSTPAGDVNLDGDIDADDIPVAVNVLLGLDTDPDHLAAADMNCDGMVDGCDIQPLVNAILFGND